MTDTEQRRIVLRIHNDDYHQAYVELADHPHALISGYVRKTVRVHNLIDGYDGPGIAIDFDENNRAIGIEILYPYADNEELPATDE